MYVRVMTKLLVFVSISVLGMFYAGTRNWSLPDSMLGTIGRCS